MPPSTSNLHLGILAFIATSAHAQLPYQPTRLFPSSKNNGQYVYLLEPPSSDTPKGQLRAFSTTDTLSARSIPFTTITPTLPFLSSASEFAYVPMLNEEGTISVYAGSCTNDAAASALWRFTPDSSDGTGTWSKKTYEVENAVAKAPQSGPNFLASAISFLPDTTENTPNLYIFGGMCPLANSTQDTWASSATYSNQLLVFRADGSNDYDFALGTSNGQPIAEAGFSITPLQPTFSKRVGGGQTQQQDFLLLGGHTQTAFINMSQVAIFSLPQAAWTFLPVNPPNAKTELMSRDQPIEVEPRSGHTAILSEDGTKVVLLGGWVGDVTNAADPQLTVLEVGVGYGGTENWQWSTSLSNQSPWTGGSGIYGHGATLLPGNVMMVIGGYTISPDGSSRVKRASQSADSHFFNISSGQWIDTFDPRLVPNSQASSASDSGPLSSDSEKAGLGVGIALFLILLAVAVVFGYFYRKKLQKERLEREQELEEEAREKEIEDLGMATYPYHDPSQSNGLDPDTGIWDGRGPMSNPAYAWTGDRRRVGNHSGGWNGRDAERSGLDLDVPSPNRGLRRSMHSRPNPYAVARFDDGRRNNNGNFPPIDELDEDDSGEKEEETTPSKQIRRKPLPASRPKSPGDGLDPFRDPDRPLAAASTLVTRKVRSQVQHNQDEPSSPAEERQREMIGWIRDWAAAGSVMVKTSNGRASPDKSDRTESTLSEQSARSAFSFKSQNTSSGSGPSRAPSARSGLGYFLPKMLNPWASPDVSPIKEDPRDARSQKHAGEDGDSFKTANTNLTHLQSESEHLLGSNSSHQHSSSSSSDAIGPDNEPTFTQRDTRQLRTKPRVGEWVIGSVRRALPTISLPGTRSASMTAASVRPAMTTGGFMDHSPVYDSSGNSSPTKRHASAPMVGPSPTPRRSASDGANTAFWIAKRGAKDWGVSASSPTKGKAGSFAGQDSREAANAIAAEQARARGLGAQASAMSNRRSLAGQMEDVDDDWDPEQAIQERVVQLMFTVPREKLRVVNADGDVGSVSDFGAADRMEDAGAGGEGEMPLQLPKVIDGHGSMDLDLEFFDGGNRQAVPEEKV